MDTHTITRFITDIGLVVNNKKVFTQYILTSSVDFASQLTFPSYTTAGQMPLRAEVLFLLYPIRSLFWFVIHLKRISLLNKLTLIKLVVSGGIKLLRHHVLLLHDVCGDACKTNKCDAFCCDRFNIISYNYIYVCCF